MKKNNITMFVLLLLVCTRYMIAGPHVDITVDANGSGDYTSISEAIDNLPMYTYERVVIFVRNGIYKEKFRIEQDNITLLGENRDSTIVQYSQLRSDWIENKDIIGPAVINIHADDLVLKNLTIKNTQPEIGPHAFTVYGTGTRTVIVNCSILSNGGDTVSLWNYKEGMYYHANCYFEGGVDFVCPRGWCFIRDSQFYENRKSVAIWHAGTLNKDQKLVIRNSSFDGVPEFGLGRHHYEAQFYLLDCTFSKNMKDEPVYHVTYPDRPERNRPYFWGDRYYYFNCHREGGDYPWFTNSLPADISHEEITASWTYDEKWNPEETRSPKVIDMKLEGTLLTLFFNENISIRGSLQLKTGTSKLLKFKMGRGRKRVQFEAESSLTQEDMESGLSIVSGQMAATMAAVKERFVENSIDL